MQQAQKDIEKILAEPFLTRLFELIDQRDLTIPEVAELTETSPHALYLWRQRKSTPRFGKFLEVCYFLGYELKLVKTGATDANDQD